MKTEQVIFSNIYVYTYKYMPAINEKEESLNWNRTGEVYKSVWGKKSVWREEWGRGNDAMIIPKIKRYN